MKFLIAITMILLANVSLAQDLVKKKAAIDTEVARISNQNKLPSVSFTIQALKKQLHYIRYQYRADKSGYTMISRKFAHNNDSIRQNFYCKGGKLIHARETIVSYYKEQGKTDSITWGGEFYFEKEKLIDYITLGHGKSEMETWDPEKNMLSAFADSKRDIARHRSKSGR